MLDREARPELYAVFGLLLAVVALLMVPTALFSLPLSVVAAAGSYAGLKSNRRRVAFAGILIAASAFVLSALVILVALFLASHRHVVR